MKIKKVKINDTTYKEFVLTEEEKKKLEKEKYGN